MEFGKLTHPELRDFIDQDYSTYHVQTYPDLPLTDQAEQIWSQLQSYSNVIYPYPVLDLYIATNYQGPEIDEYHMDEVINFNNQQIEFFIDLFELNTADDLLNRERILRILTFLDRVIHPIQILTEPIVSQKLCSELTFYELDNLIRSLGLDEISCRKKINDKDGHLNSVNRIRIDDYHYINQIEEEGSINMMLRLASQGNDELKYLIELGVDPNVNNDDGETSLMLASGKGNNNIVKILLENGAYPNTENNFGWTALLYAVVNNHVEVVNKLLEEGADPNHQTNAGQTSLISAMERYYNKISRQLLISGADPNFKSKIGTTALLRASEYGNIIGVNMLLEHGVELDVQNYDGKTAIMLAAENGWIRVVIRLIQERAAQPLSVTELFTVSTLVMEKGFIKLGRWLLGDPGFEDSDWTDLI